MKTTYTYFVQKTLAALLARWPEWEQHLQTFPSRHMEGFWIIVPAPNKQVTRGLSISTDERRIIIGFDDDHDHLQQEKKENLSAFRQRMITRIENILEDKIFAISWSHDGKLRTSNCFDLTNNRFVHSGFNRRIRSWSGQHDSDSIEP